MTLFAPEFYLLKTSNDLGIYSTVYIYIFRVTNALTSHLRVHLTNMIIILISFHVCVCVSEDKFSQIVRGCVFELFDLPCLIMETTKRLQRKK